MKIKKTCFSTTVSDLWGRDGYQPHFEVGREYWDFFDTDSEIYRRTGEHWNRIKITYIRSRVLFYIFPDVPDIEEDFMPVNCFRAASLILAELDPVKDLDENVLGDIEMAKLGYCFDDTRTIIHNWPNENEVEITDAVGSKGLFSILNDDKTLTTMLYRLSSH